MNLNKSVGKKILILLILLCLIMSTAALAGVAVAKDGQDKDKAKGPKPKLARTGDGHPFIADRVSQLAREDGFDTYDRSRQMIGILRAEWVLMENYGSEEAQAKAREVLKGLESKFFADIWINYEDNATTGLSNVTIRVGANSTSIIFPTPGWTDIAEIEMWARFIWDVAMQMYDAQKNQ